MSLIAKENILTAQYMYYQRLEELRAKVRKVVQQGLSLGEEYEGETVMALGEIEEEVCGVEECIHLLNHLLEN